MAWELVITSAPKGLKPGSSGFCPVLATRGIPPNLLDRLEALSGYRHQEIGSGTGRNPVVWSHTIVRLGTETYHVLSRVADAGRDYSGRSNKVAHHVVLKPRECPPGGPAALLMCPGVMRDHWDGQVGWLDREVSIPSITAQPQPCLSWAKTWGDSGWGGVLAFRAFSRPDDLLHFIYPDDVPMLRLFAESLALLPEAFRWRVTFTTYDLGLADVAICRWRACPASSPQAIAWRKARGLEIWDLTKPRGQAPSDGAALAGREGWILQPSGERDGGSTSRAATSAQARGLQTASAGSTVQPPDLPPVLAPADSGVFPLAERQGPPPLTGFPSNRVPSNRGNKRSFWLGFAAGMACMLVLSIGTVLGISFTPAGKVLSGIPGLIASKFSSRGGFGGKASDQAENAPQPGEKPPAAGNPPQAAPEKQQQMAGGKTAPSPDGRRTEGSPSDNKGKVSERPNSQTDGKNEEVRDKNSSAAPGTSAPDKRNSASEQPQGPSESKPEKPPAQPEKDSSANTTLPPAPSSETSQTPRTPVADGKREREFNGDPNEARLLTKLVGGPVNSVELHVEPRTHSSEVSNELVVVPVAPRLDSRPSTESRIRLYVVQYSDRNKVPDADVFYIPPDGWPKRFRLGLKDQKEVPAVPGGIALQLKTEHGWEGNIPEYRYRRSDKTLVILTIEGKGNGVTIQTKPPDDAKEELREPIPAKLGFWVEKGAQLPRRVWVTMVELEISQSK